MRSRSRAAACCAAASLSYSALAQSPPGFIAPQVVERAEAEFPEEARLSGQTGTVVVRIVVGTDGRVISDRVVQGAGHGFDESALEAARKLRFEPATRDGKPVAAQLDYEVHFELPEASPPLREAVRPAAAAPEPVFESDVEAERPLTAASARTVRERDFLLRPRMTPEDILRAVPGLILAQHQGGGKADQIFGRPRIGCHRRVGGRRRIWVFQRGVPVFDDLAVPDPIHIEANRRVLLRFVLGIGQLARRDDERHVAFSDHRHDLALNLRLDFPRLSILSREELLQRRKTVRCVRIVLNEILSKIFVRQFHMPRFQDLAEQIQDQHLARFQLLV